MPKCKANIDHSPLSWFSQLFLSLRTGAYLSLNPVGNFCMSKFVQYLHPNFWKLFLSASYPPAWRLSIHSRPPPLRPAPESRKVVATLPEGLCTVTDHVCYSMSQKENPTNWHRVLALKPLKSTLIFFLFSYSLCGIQSVFCLRPNYVDLPQIPFYFILF